jgi:hypothetical protein
MCVYYCAGCVIDALMVVAQGFGSTRSMIGDNSKLRVYSSSVVVGIVRRLVGAKVADKHVVGALAPKLVSPERSSSHVKRSSPVNLSLSSIVIITRLARLFHSVNMQKQTNAFPAPRQTAQRHGLVLP